MKIRLVLFLSFLTSMLLATTVMPGTRNILVDGTIGALSANGTNNAEWENDEQFTGADGVNWYLTWDNTSLFIGSNAVDVAQPMIIYMQVDFSGAAYSTSTQVYDTFAPDFSMQGGINFVAYIKSGYSEYRTYNGSAWSIPNPVLSATNANMEAMVLWNDVTGGNGTPDNVRFCFYHTNGNSSGIWAWGQAPNLNPFGANTNPAVDNWFGGMAIQNAIAPNTYMNESLPVELSSFSASTKNGKAILNWVTHSESNVLGFNILKNTEISADQALTITQSAIPATNSSSTASYTFEDNDVENEKTYYYWLEVQNLDGTVNLFGPTSVTLNNEGGTVTPPANEIITEFLGAGPNPFNPSTDFYFNLKNESNVVIDIYNLKGQLVKKLYNQVEQAGKHKVQWQANGFASGIYLVKLKADGKTFMKKAILLK